MEQYLMASITLSVATAPDTLTVSGIKSLGAPANIVATATPASGAAIPLGTLSAQPDGPYTISATVPPGSYTVQVSTGTTLSSDTKSSATVPVSTLTSGGNNTLGFPANIVVTATPTSGGSPITVATLVNQPVGPFSVTANVPPGEYDLATGMAVTLSSDATSSSTVLPATLTASGNNTLGLPANITVTATPSGGGSPITIGTLTNQPVGPYSVTAPVPPGTYTLNTLMSATLTGAATSSSTVLPATLTANGNNTLGVPANVVVTATPTAGGSPITIATLASQPVGPFSVAAPVPAGDYTVNTAMSAMLTSDPTSASSVAPTTLTWTGNNTLGFAADIVVTATPTGGGSPINIATLVNQPVGPYSVTAVVPPGTYTVDAALSATLTGTATSSSTVLPATLTANGNNTLGVPANVVVTATPTAGGSAVTIATLASQPVGPFSVTAPVPAGDYTVDVAMNATLTSDATSASTVAPTTLTWTDNNTLGVAADIVVTATPSGGGSPINIVTLVNQPVGPYSATAVVPPGAYNVSAALTATLTGAVTSSSTVLPATLTAIGNNTLGVPANVVVTATPTAGGSAITIATLASQPAGPFSVTAPVPAGSYTVDTAMSATLTSDATSASTVAPTTLTWTGNNTLGVAANIVVTATATGGGYPINIATLVNQPVGPYSVSAVVPPGAYTVNAALSATVTSDVTSSSTVAPTTLTSTGTNALGFPANVVVTATPSGGGSPITIATLTNEPVGPFSVTAAVPPGAYSVDTAASVTLSCPTDVAVCVPQTTLTVTGVKSLGVPADLVAVATPAGGGSPIPLGTLPSQPDGPYTFIANVPPGSYAVDVSSSIAVSAAASCSAAVPAPTLTAVITYNGNACCFTEAGGTALGNYTDPQGRFTMTNTMATNAGLPNFTVFFRRNTDGTCEHTVFEYGNPLVTVQPTNLGAYTAVISKAGVVLQTVSVPSHFWFARWRWPQSPYPITVTPAALIASGMLPHYDDSVLGQFTKSYAAFAYTPMTLAGLTTDMGMTGERGDIGLVTEWQADYICNGANLPTVLAQAEASGTYPWNMRDPTTGAAYDVLGNPKATLYDTSKASPNTVLFTACAIGTAPISLTASHEPALNFLPFLLTGDPYYLEGLQFQCCFDVLDVPSQARYQATTAERAYAWALRNAVQAAVVTPAAVPSWLWSQSYCKMLLANYLAWLTTANVDDTTDAPQAVFATVKQAYGSSSLGAPYVPGTIVDPWQDDFLAAVLAWVVQLGHTEFQPALVWKLQSTLARTNGTSGWLRSNPAMYEVAMKAAVAGPWLTSWGAAWALNMSIQPSLMLFNPADPTGNAKLHLLSEGGSITYPSYTLGALAMAARLGIAGAAAPLAWLNAEITEQLSSAITPDRKWCIT
jgi:hypothetical protein